MSDTKYPGALDDPFEVPTSPETTTLDQADGGSDAHTAFHERVGHAMNAVQAELGTDPSGGEDTVKDRLTAAEETVPINTQTDDYTAVLGDAGKVVRMNKNAAVNFTVPDLAWPTGAIINVRQIDQTVTIVEGAGVTVTPPAGFTLELSGTGQEVSLHHIGSNVWEGVGGFEEAGS